LEPIPTGLTLQPFPFFGVPGSLDSIELTHCCEISAIVAPFLWTWRRLRLFSIFLRA
jgi:hypothetical protein